MLSKPVAIEFAFRDGWSCSGVLVERNMVRCSNTVKNGCAPHNQVFHSLQAKMPKQHTFAIPMAVHPLPAANFDAIVSIS
jgi:hypothetical protein